MAAIGTNAKLLSNDVKARWLIEDDPSRIQLASVFPFIPVAGDTLCYANTPTLRPATTLGFEGEIHENTKLPADPARMFGFAEIATQFRVAYKSQDIFSSNVNDQVEVQMVLAIRELLYRFWMLFENGRAENHGEFDGLQQLVDPARVIDNGGRPLTLEALEQTKEMVRANDGRGVVIYTDSIGKRAIHAAHWRRGLTPIYQQLKASCMTHHRTAERVLSFDGAPVYVNDLSGADRTTGLAAAAAHGDQEFPATSNIWFFVMGENNLHGITPAALESGLFVTRSTLLPDGSTLVYHLTMPVGIALGSAASLAMIRNVAAPDPTADGVLPGLPS